MGSPFGGKKLTQIGAAWYLDARPRAGLSRVAGKGGGTGPASCGGDLGSHRKAAGPEAAQRGLPTKARNPPNHQQA